MTNYYGQGSLPLPGKVRMGFKQFQHHPNPLLEKEREINSSKRTYRPNVLTSYRLKQSPLTLTLSRRGRGNDAKFPKRTYSLKKKVAFTLAEVLITLGIIGVVASLVLPQKIENYQKKQVEVKLEKFYSTFNQALQRSVQEHGDMSGWTTAGWYDWENSKIFWEEYLEPYFSYVGTKDNSWGVYATQGYEILLPDGSSFNISGTWIIFYPYAKDSGNREKTWRKAFLFILSKDTNRLVPYGMGQNLNYLRIDCDKNSHYTTASKTCAAWIM